MKSFPKTSNSFPKLYFALNSSKYKVLNLNEFWCPDLESNQGHRDFQSLALPTELSGQHNGVYFVVFRCLCQEIIDIFLLYLKLIGLQVCSTINITFTEVA